MTLAGGRPEQLVHQVDPGHPLGKALTEHTARPDDGLSVRGDELATEDRLAKGGIVLELHDLRGVDRDVLARPPCCHRRPNAVDRFVHRHGVDRAPENFDTWHADYLRTTIRLLVSPNTRSRWISPSGNNRRRSRAESKVISSQLPFCCQPRVKRLFNAFCSRSGRKWKSGNW